MAHASCLGQDSESSRKLLRPPGSTWQHSVNVCLTCSNLDKGCSMPVCYFQGSMSWTFLLKRAILDVSSFLPTLVESIMFVGV